MDATTVRKTKRADELTVGDWGIDLASPTAISKVLTAFPYSDGDDRALIVYEDPDGLPATIHLMASDLIELATDEELVKLRNLAARAGRIAEIRQLADWLEKYPEVPMPYRTAASEHWNNHPGDPDTATAMTRIRQLAEQFGAKLDEHLDDRTKLEVPFGSDAVYELVVWHGTGRPVESKPITGHLVPPRDVDGTRALPVACVCDTDPLSCEVHGSSARASLTASIALRGE